LGLVLVLVLVPSFVRSFVRSFVHSFVPSVVGLFVRWFVRLVPLMIDRFVGWTTTVVDCTNRVALRCSLLCCVCVVVRWCWCWCRSGVSGGCFRLALCCSVVFALGRSTKGAAVVCRRWPRTYFVRACVRVRVRCAVVSQRRCFVCARTTQCKANAPPACTRTHTHTRTDS